VKARATRSSFRYLSLAVGLGLVWTQLAFWKVSSLLALSQAAHNASCRGPRMHHLADPLLLNCCPGNHKTSCAGRTEAAEGVHASQSTGPAISRMPSKMPDSPLRALLHPPAATPEEKGRETDIGTVLGGVQRRHLSWLLWSHFMSFWITEALPGFF
jgi:hypothetical protein